MLIVEGPDLVGKTTLCNAMLKKWWDNPRTYGSYPIIYAHFSRLPASWHYLKSYMPYITRYTIMDRFHISELCYGEVTRGKTSLTPGYLRILEAMLALAGSYTVVITAEEAWLKQRYEKLVAEGRDEMFKLDQVLTVNKAYETVQERHECKIDMIYRIANDDDLPSSCDALMHNILSAWSERLSVVHGFTNGGSIYEPASREVEEVHGFRG